MAGLKLNRPQTHIVLSDSHAHPDFHNKRFDWFAKLVNDVKPDVVVDIGDLFDMPSLCTYDKGTKGFEGRRYRKDIEAGLDAQERMYNIIRQQKKKLPRFVRTLGNHEQRIVKAVERDPVLEGTIGLQDLCSKDYGWEEYPFLTPVGIDNIVYQHYYVSGVLARPIGGERHAQTLLSKNFASSTCGHSHLFDYAVRRDVNGRSIHGCVVGVYQDYDAAFAGPANALWDRGVVIKRNVQGGSYDLERVSLDRLRKEYG